MGLKNNARQMKETDLPYDCLPIEMENGTVQYFWVIGVTQNVGDGFTYALLIPASLDGDGQLVDPDEEEGIYGPNEGVLVRVTFEANGKELYEPIDPQIDLALCTRIMEVLHREGCIEYAEDEPKKKTTKAQEENTNDCPTSGIVNYYKVLGVSRSATEQEIKRAYKSLVKQWHPDVCKKPNAHQKFIEITEAYEVLSNPKTREEYANLFEHSRHSSYSSKQEYDFVKQSARRRAEEYWRKSLSDVIELISNVGAVAYEVGKVIVSGEEGVRERITLGARMAIGFKGIMLLICIVLSFTGVLLPITIPIGFLTYRSLMHNQQFIGLRLLFESTLITLGVILTLLVLMFIIIRAQLG